MNKPNIFSLPVFSLEKKEKKIFHFFRLKELFKHHIKKCNAYSVIYSKVYNKFKVNYKNLFEFTIPVKLFKSEKLISISNNDVYKILESSGTTGLITSKIYLDKKTSLIQSKALTKIVSFFLGSKRLPMLIVDFQPEPNKLINARTAAINGFSIFATNKVYFFKRDGVFNKDEVFNFIKKYHKEKFLIFGFTSIIFDSLVRSNFIPVGTKLTKAILIHGGGWKKLESQKITNKLFNQRLKKKYYIERIHNYYGMVEQTGSIFMECDKCNKFTTSNFSDVAIRDSNLKILTTGKKGFVQLISLLPTSYPGQNILTEDIGEITGEDNCPCGIKGKYFKIYGRSKRSEKRGCSDVY